MLFEGEFARSKKNGFGIEYDIDANLLSKEVLGMTDTMDGEGLIAILDNFEMDFMTGTEFTQLRKKVYY